MESIFAALEDVRRLAEDMLPGATARLMSPQAEDPLARIALANDGPIVEGAFGAAIPLRLDDQAIVAILGVRFSGPPPADTAERLARLARIASFSPALGDDTEARRAALVSIVRSIPLRAVFLDHDLCILAASPTAADELGMPEAEYLGRPIDWVIPEYGRFREAFQRGLGGETIRAPRVRSQVGDAPPPGSAQRFIRGVTSTGASRASSSWPSTSATWSRR